ncbi:hypothetical protein AWB82_04258 [Caballeronia glebae]|uniref:Uncharacterized protein n=2 Tax=Caballeronia glebae TaxID=1777143 RepID=A0A158BKM1_9BURK|nr:hypothetical protein AWB82_04258 [Caballeronia glebae]
MKAAVPLSYCRWSQGSVEASLQPRKPNKVSFMHRVIAYRNFEIDVQLTPAAEDMFDVTFQIKGGTNLDVLGARGSRIPLRNGPFTERWAYLVGEISGQAAIDVLLGPVE